MAGCSLSKPGPVTVPQPPPAAPAPTPPPPDVQVDPPAPVQANPPTRGQADPPATAQVRPPTTAQVSPPATVPIDAPAIPQAPRKERARLPLWGPADLSLVHGELDQRSAGLYQPVTIKGIELQPMQLPQGTVLLQLKDDAVWVHGVLTQRNEYRPLLEPSLLYRLPLQVGDRWAIRFFAPNAVYDYKVAAEEPTPTPAGEQEALRISVSERGQLVQEEWWVPGYGLVREAPASGRLTVAKREVRAEPKPLPGLGAVAPEQPVLLWTDGNRVWVADLEGSERLFEAPVTAQDRYFWVQVGEQFLLGGQYVALSTSTNRYSAWRYDTESGRFERVAWVSPGGESDGIAAGVSRWFPDGTFQWWNADGYPVLTAEYRFDGQVMRQGAVTEIRPFSPYDFVTRLFNSPRLADETFIALFKDPAQGITAAQQRPRSAQGLWVAPIEGEEGSFLVTVDGLRFTVQVEKGPKDFQVIRFAPLP